jgi:hypothetical protein
MPTFPEWWNWNLSFTSHAELRMEQRRVTERTFSQLGERNKHVVEVRAMLEKATGIEPNVVEGIHDPRPPPAEPLDRDRRAGC